MPFRPAAIPTAASAAALVVLINLSAWQYGRHVDAGERREAIHHNLYAPPAANADTLAPPASLAWRKAALTGRFRDAERALITGRFEFGAPGYDVVVPFEVDGAGTVLVNRGWVPASGVDAALTAIDTHGAPSVVEGLLLDIDGDADLRPLPAAGERPAAWPMEADTFAGLPVRRVGPPYAAIAASFPAPPRLVLVVGPPLVKGQSKRPEPLPVSGYVPEPKHIGHLEYAIQWALIAATLVTLWALHGWRRGQVAEAP